jgi:hypothetical protein
MVVTPKLASVRTPGPAWPMGSAVPGLIHIDKATRGARDSICPSAWVRFSVWTHGLDCSWVRGFVGSSVWPVGVLWRRLQRLATSLASSPTTTAPRTPGFTVSRACRPFPPVRRRGGSHRLRADGRGRGRGRDITGEKVKPYAAGRHPSAASGGGQDRRLRASRSGRGRKTPPCQSDRRRHGCQLCPPCWTSPDRNSPAPPPERGLPAPPQYPDGEHYREIAGKLREIARQCRFPGARRELLHLAANYERRGNYIDSRSN